MSGTCWALVACAGFVVAGALSARQRYPESVPPVFNPGMDSIIIVARAKAGTTTMRSSMSNLTRLSSGEPCEIGHEQSDNGVGLHTHSPGHVVSFLEKWRPARAWLLVTTRKLFAQLPSAYFQLAANGPPFLYGTKEAFLRMTLEEKLKDFHDLMAGKATENINKLTNYMRLNNLLTRSMDNYYSDLGINISSHPFDFDKKILHIQHVWKSSKLEVLIVRLEDVALWEQLLQPYFPGFKTIPDRFANNSDYAAAYKEFQNSLTYTSSEKSVMLQSQTMTQFYTPEERATVNTRQTHFEPFDLSVHDSEYTSGGRSVVQTVC